MHCVVRMRSPCLSLGELVRIALGCGLEVDDELLERVEKARKAYLEYARSNWVYGYSSGVGALHKRERRFGEDVLLLEHAAGLEPLLEPEAARLVTAVRVQQLVQGGSPVRSAVVRALARLVSPGLAPAIPSRGSVGASGDLAPLAHLALLLRGRGRVFREGRLVDAFEALKTVGVKPVELEPGEALSLMNGTAFTVGTALYAVSLLLALLMEWSWVTGFAIGLSTINPEHYSPRVLASKRFPYPNEFAAQLLEGMQAAGADVEGRGQGQDPYSLRCVPQLLQSVYATLKWVVETLLCEACSPSDNPLIRDGRVYHQCGFHGVFVAAAVEAAALTVSYLANAGERRIAQLLERGPTSFLGDDRSPHGLMLAHYTAASITAEVRSLAAPLTVHSIPTSGVQEDFVSMSAPAAVRLLNAVRRLIDLAAIELAVAARLASTKGVGLNRYPRVAEAAAKLGSVEVSELIRTARSELEARVRERLRELPSTRLASISCPSGEGQS